MEKGFGTSVEQEKRQDVKEGKKEKCSRENATKDATNRKSVQKTFTQSGNKSHEFITALGGKQGKSAYMEPILLTQIGMFRRLPWLP